MNLSIDKERKFKIIEIITINEREKHSREIVMIESMIAQVIDVLNM